MFKTLLTAGVMALGMASTSSAATVIFSDNFDTEFKELDAPLNNWNVTNGTVDVIGTGFYELAGPGTYLDMDGSIKNGGRIETKTPFSAIEGLLYQLSFSFAKNAANAETLNFGFAGWADTLNLPTGPLTVFQPAVYTFTAVSTGQFSLFFEDLSNDNQGVLLDNVVLSAVPLPAGGLLLLGGIAALAGLRRRKLV